MTTTLSHIAPASLVALLLIAACAHPADQWRYDRDRVAADAIADDVAFGDASAQEAEAAYRALIPRADEDSERRYIAYRLALLAERDGRFEEALDRYAALYRRPTGFYDRTAGDALLRTAEILRGPMEQPEAAYDVLLTLIETFPNTSAAGLALQELFDWHREAPEQVGPLSALLSYLERLYPAVSETDIADDIVYRTARVVDEQYGQPREAIALYDVILLRFHRSAFYDDARWRRAAAYRALGDIETERRLLREFVDSREESWLVIAYDSEYYAPAYMRLAEIASQRGDQREVIDIYEEFIATFPLSLEIDDLRYEILQLQLALGDRGAARKTYERLVGDDPESRYVERGAALLAEHGVTP